MKRYNEENFSVLNVKTGKKIADCGEEFDAVLLVSLDPQNRTYTKNKFLMDQVIDIQIPKALPTTDIVAVHDVPEKNFDEYFDKLLKPKQIELPEGQGKPVKV